MTPFVKVVKNKKDYNFIGLFIKLMTILCVDLRRLELLTSAMRMQRSTR